MRKFQMSIRLSNALLTSIKKRAIQKSETLHETVLSLLEYADKQFNCDSIEDHEMKNLKVRISLLEKSFESHVHHH
jgi:hypothetical protein